MKFFLRVTITLIVFAAIVAFTCLQLVPSNELINTEHYKTWKNMVAANEIQVVNYPRDSIQVGYSKVNFTPRSPSPMAGYGKRKGSHFESVQDSIFVRTISITSGEESAYIISLDLLIVPPPVTELVKQKCKELGINFSNVYLGATHSHNSIGGWYNTLVGELFAGEYNPKTERWIANKVIESIEQANESRFAASVQYQEDIDSSHIQNRLLHNTVDVDPEIRSIVFKGSRDSVILSTYAAHSTILTAEHMNLSRDYPGEVVDQLEANGYTFAMFMAGAVGSMGPVLQNEPSYKEVRKLGSGVSEETLSRNEYQSEMLSIADFACFHSPIPMPKPAPKITPSLALKPWLFYKLFGEYPAYVKSLKIGTTLLVGMPCDFSGELMAELDAYASDKGLNLIVTSFNGAYTGYVVNDEHFDMDRYETVTMSWYGPHVGHYFSEIIRDIIDVNTK